MQSHTNTMAFQHIKLSGTDTSQAAATGLSITIRVFHRKREHSKQRYLPVPLEAGRRRADLVLAWA